MKQPGRKQLCLRPQLVRDTMNQPTFSLRYAVFLLIFLQFLHTTVAFSAQPQPSVSFEQFQFAPNGVCIEPAIFLEPSRNGEGTRKFTMRNVPGTGDCMFQAVILASLTSMGMGGNDVLLRAISRETRAVVAQILQSEGTLNIEGNRLVPARDLLLSASSQEGLTPAEYLQKLQLEGREGGLYGGGPELTVLSNVLRRPISIYELDKTGAITADDNSSSCPIQCMGVFGDRFADPCAAIPNSAVLSGLQPGAYSWHLHVLVLDVESTGEKHACVLLPQDAPQQAIPDSTSKQ